jgi:hypothetical protein
MEKKKIFHLSVVDVEYCQDPGGKSGSWWILGSNKIHRIHQNPSESIRIHEDPSGSIKIYTDLLTFVNKKSVLNKPHKRNISTSFIL